LLIGCCFVFLHSFFFIADGNLIADNLISNEATYILACYMIIVEFILFFCSNIEFPGTNSNSTYNGCDWSIWIIQGLFASTLFFYPNGNRVTIWRQCLLDSILTVNRIKSRYLGIYLWY
jgi:hypothetical protein